MARTRCPRCGEDSLVPRIGRYRELGCTNPRCAWPRPEPGPIHRLRWQLQGRADTALAAMRKRALWPPVP